MSSAVDSSVVDTSGADADDCTVTEMLNRMYLKVDPFRTGQVRATALVSAFESVLDHPAVDKWKMEELRRILDPKSDDVPVLREQFAEGAARWLESITLTIDSGVNVPARPAGDSAATENRDGETDAAKSPRFFKARPWNGGVSRLESNASSLGLLNVSDLDESRDITVGSLNGTGSFGRFQIPLDDAADANGEEMKNMQKRLSDEKLNRETLRNQLEECEEENEELKKQLNETRRELLDAKKTIRDNEKRLEKIETTEKERDREEAENEDKENDGNLANVEEVDLAKRKIKEVRDELTKSKLREKEALDMADELKLKIRNMESSNEKTECKERSKIKELVSIRERLEEEIQRLQNDCTFLRDEAGDSYRSFAANGHAAGGGIIGSAVLEDISFDNILLLDDESPAKTNFLQLPSAQSTPFVRRNLSPGPASIGEEFRKMGVQRRGLPFCEKNGSQDDSQDKSRSKKRVTFSVGTQTEPQEEEERAESGLKALLSWLKENRASLRFPRYRSFKEVFDDLRFVWREYPGRKKDAEAAKRWLKNLAKALFWLAASLLLFLILFTFFGAVNVNGRTLYPSTWRPQIGPFQMPRPFEFFTVKYHPVF